MKKIFLTAIIILALSAPVFVLAQTCPPGKTGLQCASGLLDTVAGTDKTGLSGDLSDTVATVIKAVLALVGTIFLVLTIYAGILWMTAQGNDEQVTKAVGIIKASVVGLIIIMSAYAITYFVTSKLVGATGTTNQPAAPSNSVLCGQATFGSACQNATAADGSHPCWWHNDACEAI